MEVSRKDGVYYQDTLTILSIRREGEICSVLTPEPLIPYPKVNVSLHVIHRLHPDVRSSGQTVGFRIG